MHVSTPPSSVPPPPPPPPPPTQIVGQQSAPSTTVPDTGPMPPPSSINIAGRKMNSLAMVSLITAIAAPFGHIIGVGGITLIVVSLITGHMARAQIKKTGEDGATVALVGLIISYIHLAITVLIVIFFFGVILAFLTVIFHAAASSG